MIKKLLLTTALSLSLMTTPTLANEQEPQENPMVKSLSDEIKRNIESDLKITLEQNIDVAKGKNLSKDEETKLYEEYYRIYADISILHIRTLNKVLDFEFKENVDSQLTSIMDEYNNKRKELLEKKTKLDGDQIAQFTQSKTTQTTQVTRRR